MYLRVGAKGVQSSAKIGGQGISSIAALLREGGMCLGDASFVGVNDGLFVFGMGSALAHAVRLSSAQVMWRSMRVSLLSWQRQAACRSKALCCALFLKELGTGVGFCIEGSVLVVLKGGSAANWDKVLYRVEMVA